MRSVAGAGHYLWADFVALQRTLEDGFDVSSAFGGDEAQRIMKTEWVKRRALFATSACRQSARAARS